MNILECSSKGDKRFSAFYANVNFNGVLDSIEHHYQNCKYKENGDRCHKGEKVAYILIANRKLSPKYLTPFYRYLWFKYLKEHTELVEYANNFDKFNDMFRGHCINCQADCIEAYVKHNVEFFNCINDLKHEFKKGY